MFGTLSENENAELTAADFFNFSYFPEGNMFIGDDVLYFFLGNPFFARQTSS